MFNSQQPYTLDPLPPKLQLSDETKNLLADARQALEGLKASLEFFEDPHHLVRKSVLQESVSSSKIENIRTTVVGALEDSVKEEKDMNPGNKEALKYTEALMKGWDYMRKYSLSMRTVLEIHKILDIKQAGQIRKQQNAIKGRGDQIIYTPPVANKVSELMSDWQAFVHEYKGLHPIIKAIVAHYQFEAIHPFADGNGRTGRILIVLQLLMDEVISLPAFYISGYLKNNSDKYKDLLLEVSENKNWSGYINFMLKGFIAQANQTRSLIRSIHRIKVSMKREIRSTLPKIYSSELINSLFERPVTYTEVLSKDLGIARKTAAKYLRQLEERGFLVSQKTGRYMFFVNKSLVNVLTEASE